MKSFKKWINEEMSPSDTMGEPKGPKPGMQDKVATNLVNRNISKNPNFLPQMANAGNDPQRLDLISQQASGIIKQNPTAVKAADIQPDLINQKLAGVAGLDVKRFFLKKMKKKMGKK